MAATPEFVPEDYHNPTSRTEKFEEIGHVQFLSTEELDRLGVAIHEAATVDIDWDVGETKPDSEVCVPMIFATQLRLSALAVALVFSSDRRHP